MLGHRKVMIDTSLRSHQRPQPSATSASLRLDELTAEDESLRRALARAPQDARLSAALLIIEDERMAIEKALLL